jgi:capsular polysaccharide transport system permease protein
MFDQASAQRITAVLRGNALAKFGLLSRLRSLNKLFVLTVVLPTAISTAYYGLIASDVYVSQASFVVRKPSKGSDGSSPLTSLLQSAGVSASQDDAYVVNTYITSRDALDSLNRSDNFRAAYSGNHGDIFSRFNATGLFASDERLLDYYQDHVSVYYDTTTSISTLEVHSFSAENARRFNERLLELSEQLVNRMNARARNDLVKYAQDQVARAETRVRNAAAALSAFRNRQSVFDPDKESAIQLQQVAQMRSDLITARTKLAQLRSIAPNNPQIETLKISIATMEAEIDHASRDVAGGTGSLANKDSAYQQVALEREFANEQLTAALASLESARNQALHQQLYLERVSQPNLADEAMLPHRGRNIIITLLLGLVSWGTLSLLISSIREHRD